MRVIKFVAVIMAGAILAAPAMAQLSGKGGPIQVKADRSEVLDKQKQVVITGNVDIVQADTALRADKVVLNYTGSSATRSCGIGGSFGDIKSMQATGNVFYLTPDLKANGQTGVYDAVNETVKLGGPEVILQRGEDYATGKCLVMNLKAGRTDLYGSPCGTEENSGRVIFLIDQATAAGSNQ